MKLEVEIISREIIKPSSLTPSHLRHYQLSFLDQIAPMVYNPIVLFYSHNDTLNTTTISNTLKNSLSNILTHFYPLAGRMNNKNFIHCNDEGIPYIETRITNYNLKDIIQNPIPNELNRLIPFQLDDITNITFGIQLNFFSCGGIAIGACLSHQIADGLSLFNFLNSWANITRKSIFPKPIFDSSKLFPPKNISGFDPRSGITKENIVCKIFVFNADVVENLRAKYINFNPTRVEALSAFIWSRYIDVIYNDGVQRNYGVVHAVNLRQKMEPPLPSESFGNYLRFTITIPKMNSGEECYGLAKQVRNEIKKIDKEYVKKVQEGKQHLEFLKESFDRVVVKEELVVFNFTSLCRFPLYDADFGWGKPIWVGSTALNFKNLVVFVDCKDGGGIEAYVSLKVEDMVKFEADLELLACVNK